MWQKLPILATFGLGFLFYLENAAISFLVFAKARKLMAYFQISSVNSDSQLIEFEFEWVTERIMPNLNIYKCVNAN